MAATNVSQTTRPATLGRRRSRPVSAAAGLAGIALLAVTVSAIAPVAAMAATYAVTKAAQPPCAATPGSCGLPDAATTGVPARMRLRRVPSQVSRGPGWHYDARGWVQVNGNGAVLSGLNIHCNVDIAASHVTIKDVKVVHGAGSSFGISLRHTANVTIENSDISGVNATTGRVADAIDDIYGDSTGMVIKDNNISDWRTAVQVSSGLVTGNYIHDPGFAAGDHTNGIYDTGSTQPLTISGNTILNSLAQTDDITLEASASGKTVANKTITGNLLAGGGYSIYAGASQGNTTANIVIQNNKFSQRYFAQGGRYGPATYFDHAGRGNLWSGNTWAGTGQAVPVP